MANLTFLVSVPGKTFGVPVFDANGDLLDTTVNGGSSSDGSVFEILKTATGYATTLTTLASFTGSFTNGPEAGLVADANGNLFGTTYQYGTSNDGSVFELAKTPTGYATTPTILVNFTGSNGSQPESGLITDANGDLFGTTSTGGANNYGTVYEITKTATGYATTPTTLVNFTSANGANPIGGLITDANGDLFGTTSAGGPNSNGTVFEIAKTTNGYATAPTTLVGSGSSAGLIADATGDLFGTDPSGAIFELVKTTSGYASTLTTLATLNGGGSEPALIADANGDLFGTTPGGGTSNVGTVFELAKTVNGYATTPTTLVSFNTSGGEAPETGLAADANGNLFGTTFFNASTSDGTVFEVTNTGFVVTCYRHGTRILTTRGDVAVEDLKMGELVITASGEHRPIRWLGHQTINCRSHAHSTNIMPIRIAAQALGVNKPARDLYVSPGHSICFNVIEEVLIPASALINGSTIVQVDVDEVTYWHVELDSHDIILAENLPAESYLEMGNRAFFRENIVTALDALPDAVVNTTERTHADFCRPFHDSGPLVDAIKQQIRSRSCSIGWTLTDAPLADLDLHLMVDGVRVEPTPRGLTVRFAVPAGAKDVWLMSNTSRPSDVSDSTDGRDLGAFIVGFSIEDGFTPSYKLDLADPLLCVGFYGLEEGCRRWTAGRARLPAALWADSRDGFFLRVDLWSSGIPRWAAPEPKPSVCAESVDETPRDRTVVIA